MSTECILNSFFTGASLSYASMHPFTPAGVRQRRGSVAHASCYPVLIRWLETTSEQVLSQYPIFWDSVQNFDQTGTVYRKLLQYEKQALDYVYAIGQNLSTVQYLKYPHEFNPRLKDLPHGELPLWQRLRLAALRYLYSISRGSNTTEDHTFLVQVCRSVLKKYKGCYAQFSPKGLITIWSCILLCWEMAVFPYDPLITPGLPPPCDKSLAEAFGLPSMRERYLKRVRIVEKKMSIEAHRMPSPPKGPLAELRSVSGVMDVTVNIVELWPWFHLYNAGLHAAQHRALRFVKETMRYKSVLQNQKQCSNKFEILASRLRISAVDACINNAITAYTRQYTSSQAFDNALPSRASNYPFLHGSMPVPRLPPAVASAFHPSFPQRNVDLNTEDGGTAGTAVEAVKTVA